MTKIFRISLFGIKSIRFNNFLKNIKPDNNSNDPFVYCKLGNPSSDGVKLYWRCREVQRRGNQGSENKKCRIRIKTPQRYTKKM